MPLIVETGAGVANANSYCSDGRASVLVDELGALAEWTDVIAASSEDGLLIAATRLIEARYPWLGAPLTTTQGLGLPRANLLIVEDDVSTAYLQLEDGRLLTGSAQIALAAEATAYVALQLWRTRWTADGRIVVSETLPDYSVRYAPAQLTNSFEVVDAILAPITAARVPAGYAA